METTPWRHIILTVLSGLFLVAAFYTAANLHFRSIDIGINTVRKTRDYEIAKDRERQLLLKVEIKSALMMFENGTLPEILDDELNKTRLDLQNLQVEIDNAQAVMNNNDKNARIIVASSLVFTFLCFLVFIILSRLNQSVILGKPLSLKFSDITDFLFSSKNQKEVFQPIVADWQDEYYAALSKDAIWKSRWINTRYTFAFIVAIWQKSPIGELIESVKKIAT